MDWAESTLRLSQTLESIAPMSRAAAVTIFVPTPLRRYCGDVNELSLNAANVRRLLEELECQYPELHRCVCNETGAVRQHINIFVNEEHMRELAGIETSLESGDVVTIMTAVSGG